MTRGSRNLLGFRQVVTRIDSCVRIRIHDFKDYTFLVPNLHIMILERRMSVQEAKKEVFTPKYNTRCPRTAVIYLGVLDTNLPRCARDLMQISTTHKQKVYVLVLGSSKLSQISNISPTCTVSITVGSCTVSYQLALMISRIGMTTCFCRQSPPPKLQSCRSGTKF